MRCDRERLEEFRVLRAGIPGSSRHLIIGIDVAKERHHAFFGTATGATLRKRLAFANQRSAFERLVALSGDLQAQYNLPQRVFGLEPTGVYHKPLLEYLVRAGEPVVLVSNVPQVMVACGHNLRKLLRAFFAFVFRPLASLTVTRERRSGLGRSWGRRSPADARPISGLQGRLDRFEDDSRLRLSEHRCHLSVESAALLGSFPGLPVFH